MKSLSEIIQETVAQPKGGDEKRFKAQHNIVVKNHPTYDPKSMIANISKKKRLADRDDDKAAYDQAYDKSDDIEDFNPIVGEETILEAKSGLGEHPALKKAGIKHRWNQSAFKRSKTFVTVLDSDYQKTRKALGKDAAEEGGNVFIDTVKSLDEETILEAVIDDLRDIVKNKSIKDVKFADGQKLKVDMTTANAMVKVHDALNDTNKKKFADAINKNENMFMKMVDFAFSKVK